MRMVGDFFRYVVTEAMTVNRQSPPCRNLGSVSRLHHNGAQATHFFLKNSHGIFHARPPQGVAADKFCKTCGLVGRSRLARAHLI